jgi:hypothetical protein
VARVALVELGVEGLEMVEVVVEGLEVVDVVVEGFAAVVDVVAAALGAVAYAAWIGDEEKLRCVPHATGTPLDDEAERRAEKPLRNGVAAILCVMAGV